MHRFIIRSVISIIFISPISLIATDNVNVTNSHIVVVNQTNYSKNEIIDLQILKEINQNIVNVSLKILQNKQFVKLMDYNKLFLKNSDKSKHVNLKKIIMQDLLDYKTNELLLNKFLNEVYNIDTNLEISSRYKEMKTYVNNINHYLNSDTSRLSNFDRVIMNYIKLQKLQLEMVLNSNSSLIKNIYNKTYTNTKLKKYHSNTMLKITSDDYNKLLHQYKVLICFIYEWSGTGFKMNTDIKYVKEELDKFLGEYYKIKSIEKNIENNKNIDSELNSLVK